MNATINPFNMSQSENHGSQPVKQRTFVLYMGSFPQEFFEPLHNFRGLRDHLFGQWFQLLAGHR
jgi:hypothetical protein